MQRALNPATPANHAARCGAHQKAARQSPTARCFRMARGGWCLASSYFPFQSSCASGAYSKSLHTPVRFSLTHSPAVSASASARKQGDSHPVATLSNYKSVEPPVSSNALVIRNSGRALMPSDSTKYLVRKGGGAPAFKNTFAMIRELPVATSQQQQQQQQQ